MKYQSLRDRILEARDAHHLARLHKLGESYKLATERTRKLWKRAEVRRMMELNNKLLT